ncbi:hypothetical protein L1987_15010 [Smallanthus sonchifolius]|uniref:Uncharacterized protein n=1 Tax=Smallanthus sonchifolius TaxID=185202 RepID=A0ACB9J6Z1_9ASTR|nr:hypothetical protein L1987_15010 [Smallanthus sonchifolius]
MPRKKDPPPSVLSPRRSTRCVALSTSTTDGEDSATLVVPCVGLSDSQKGLERAPQPSSLDSSMKSDASFHADGISLAGKTGLAGCEGSAGISGIPSLSVSSSADELVRDGIETCYGSLLKNSHYAAENSTARKPGFAGGSYTSGESESESSGSPGVQPLLTDSLGQSGSLKVSAGIGSAVVGLDPPRTRLFSPEFKAMLSRDYPKTSTVFRPNAPPLIEPVHESCDLPGGVAQIEPDVCMQPSDGIGHGSDVLSPHAKVGTTLNSGFALDEGMQFSNELGKGMPVSHEMGDFVHGGSDLPKSSSLMVEAAKDVGIGDKVDPTILREGPEVPKPGEKGDKGKKKGEPN